MKVLSIDWDYFVNADDSFRIMNFPDGNNRLSAELQNMIWSTKYAGNAELEKIGILEEHLSDVVGHIAKACFKKKSPLRSANTEHCGILRTIAETTTGKIEVYNVDFHSDAYKLRKEEEPHCGNWLTYLHRRKKIKRAVWIRNENHYTIPKEEYGEQHETPAWLEISDISIIRNMNFDVVFICHSPAWSPPHLDQIFINSFEIFFRYEDFQRAFPNRWTVMGDAIEQQRQIYKEIMNLDKLKIKYADKILEVMK